MTLTSPGGRDSRVTKLVKWISKVLRFDSKIVPSLDKSAGFVPDLAESQRIGAGTSLVGSLGVGYTNCTIIKCGFAFAQASALSFVSKKRSITIALRSAAFRPHDRAALRLTTSGPLSTARHSAS